MRVEDSFYFGKIVRKHSYKGEIVVKLDPDYFELTTELESIWIVQNNHLVPFFLERVNYQRETFFRIKLEGVNSEQEADKLIGSAIYLNRDFLPKSKGINFYKHEVIGFEIIDVNKGKIGKINRVNDTTPQLLFEINNGSKTLLIPAIPEFLQKIDRKKKTITVITPDGLFDL